MRHFLAAPGDYDAWKQRLADRAVALIDEIAWVPRAWPLSRHHRSLNRLYRGKHAHHVATVRGASDWAALSFGAQCPVRPDLRR